MLTEAITVICGIFFVGLFSHWLMVRKMGRWKGLPGPYTPLVFVLKSLFTSNNVIIWRETYKKYQKVNKLLKNLKSNDFIVYQGGLCFIPLMNVPLLFVGNFNTLKFLYNHPGQYTVYLHVLKTFTHYFEQMSRAGLLCQRANFSSSFSTIGHRRCREIHWLASSLVKEKLGKNSGDLLSRLSGNLGLVNQAWRNLFGRRQRSSASP